MTIQMRSHIIKIKYNISLVLFFYVVIISSPLITPSTAVQTTCPECYNDQNPFTGYRFGYSDDSRQTLRIAVDTTGMSTAQINAAVTGQIAVMNNWNAATDGTANEDNKIPYKFEGASTTDITDTDFIIRIGTPSGGCGDMNTGVFPHVITISASLLATAPENIAALLSHELGHRMGLDNATGTVACGASTTIMRGQIDCVQVVQNIQPSDV